jgi:hypothetical protein
MFHLTIVSIIGLFTLFHSLRLLDIFWPNDLEDLSRSLLLKYKLIGKIRGRAERDADEGGKWGGEFVT